MLTVSSLQFIVFAYLVLQTKQLADLKVLLRDSAERERALMQDKQDLEEKVIYFSAFQHTCRRHLDERGVHSSRCGWVNA